MHVSWSFLDKRQATMDAIGAYNAMNFIVKHTAEDIQKVRERMGGATSPTLDGMPHTLEAGRTVFFPASRRLMCLRSGIGRQLSTWTGSSLHGIN